MNSLELAYKIRKHALEMTHKGNSSHIGSILSLVDIISVLYNDCIKHNPKDPKWEDRDRVILSKGHAGVAIYSVLAEMGYFSKTHLDLHCSNGSNLSGHISHHGVPGVEFSTGSLGHGLSVGAGMALAAKKNNKIHKIYVILGDGECNEGRIWEAAMFCNHYKLNNIIAIVDYNKMQGLGLCEDIMALEPFADKWRAFGWNTLEIDGHSHDQIRISLNFDTYKISKPTVIIANTIKGKGVSFMENNLSWHYKSPKDSNYLQALIELEETEI